MGDVLPPNQPSLPPPTLIAVASLRRSSSALSNHAAPLPRCLMPWAVNDVASSSLVITSASAASEPPWKPFRDPSCDFGHCSCSIGLVQRFIPWTTWPVMGSRLGPTPFRPSGFCPFPLVVLWATLNQEPPA